MGDPKSKFGVPEPEWLSSRARNAARRPLFIGLSAAIIVALAGLSLVLAPKNRRPMGPAAAVNDIRIDTVQLLAALGRAHSRVASADSALLIVRREVATYNAEPRVDSV